MLLPELNTPVGFAGKDGFYWWIGQVETDKDIKSSNRYKVRIVGQHLKSCEAVPVDDLPWATVMLPVTAPASEGNSNYHPAKLQKGDWVIGFFLDGASGQHPVIMGQMQKVYNSTTNSSLETSKTKDQCLSFSRYVPPTNTSVAMPAGATDAAARQTENQPPSTALQASSASHSASNPFGSYSCLQIADANCKKTDTAKTRFEQILTEFFGNVSQNGGQVGTKMLSNVSGTVFDYAGAASGYVTRVFGVANAYIKNAKFKMLALIKEGVKQVIKFCMGVPTPTTDPKTGSVKKTERVGVLGKLVKWLNDQLGKINCTFADLEDKILNFLTELITSLLTDVVNAATCVIESIVSQILSEIETFLTDAISLILGPLESILGIIASPLNILGAALAYLFEMLGISCSGPGEDCASAEQTQLCSGSANKKKPGEDDFKKLDELIANIESQGVEELQSSCSESYALPCPEVTTASASGGTPGPGTTPAPTPPTSPTSPYSTFFPTTPLTPTPSNTPTVTPPIVYPPINVTINSFNTLNLFGTTNTTALSVPDNIYSNTSYQSLKIAGISKTKFVPLVSSTSTPVTYFLSANKTRVTQNESITFTLSVTSGSVPDGTEFDYLLFGFIQKDDFVGGSTIGKMRMSGNVGVSTITISNNISIANEEDVTFNLLGPGLSQPFTIYNSNPVAPTTTTPTIFTPPTLGNPIVDNNGRIIDIPIVDPGDRYLTPPFIKIYGTGLGGYASAELDSTGRLVKVRVDRPGVGYTPTISSRDNCYIDGFIVIRPGYGYKTPPKIYVDGDPNIAQAILNDAGNLTSVKIINKVKTFNTFPSIEIIGGGGNGAKAIPSFSCVERELYNKYVASVAPGGVDSVVDCPNGDCDDCSI